MRQSNRTLISYRLEQRILAPPCSFAFSGDDDFSRLLVQTSLSVVRPEATAAVCALAEGRNRAPDNPISGRRSYGADPKRRTGELSEGGAGRALMRARPLLARESSGGVQLAALPVEFHRAQATVESATTLVPLSALT